jgi:aryl-alcohol dehydrogenase-like predicted oxidoreductase
MDFYPGASWAGQVKAFQSSGNAQDMLGPAFEPYRKNCFLACKTLKRDAAGAEEELHSSLQKMRTEYFDLYQLHAISSIEDETISDLSLRFTFSRGVTAAIPPGEYKFWDRAVNIAMKSTDISEDEIAQLQKTAEEITPLFKA